MQAEFYGLSTIVGNLISKLINISKIKDMNACWGGKKMLETEKITWRAKK